MLELLIKRKKGVIHTTSPNLLVLVDVNCKLNVAHDPSPGLGRNRRVRGIDAYRRLE